MSRPASAGPTRRRVLVGGSLLALAGCLPADQPEPRPSLPPEFGLRMRVAGQVAELARRYTAVVERFPEMWGELSPLAAEHDEHVAALAGPLVRPPRQLPPSTPSGPGTRMSGTPSGTPSGPATPAQARAELAAAERAASRQRTRQARRASAELARLLASVAACEAAHAALLERGS